MFWFIKKCKQIFVCFSLPTAVTKSLQWTVSIHKLFSCNLSSKLSKKSYSHPCISWDQCGISPASHSPSCFFADEGFYPTGFVFPSAQGQPLSWHLCAFPALRSAALSIQKLSTLCGVYTGHPCPFKNHLPCVVCIHTIQVIPVCLKTIYLVWCVYRHPCPFKNHLPCVVCIQVIPVVQKLSTSCGMYTGHLCLFKNHLPCVVCTQVIPVHSKTIYLVCCVHRSSLSIQKQST